MKVNKIRIDLAQELIKKIFIPIIVAGSIKRNKNQVKDIDIITNIKYKEYFDNNKLNLEISKILMNGDRHCLLQIKYKNENIKLDIFYYYDSKELPCLINYLTGNKYFNIAMRSLFKRKGYKLNQYYCEDKQGNLIYFNNEKELFNFVGLKFIPPELREVKNINHAFNLFKEFKIRRYNIK